MANNKRFNLRLEQHILNEQSGIKNSDELDTNSLEYIDYAKKDNQDFFNKFNLDNLVHETKKRSETKKDIISFPTKIISGIITVAACLIITLNILPANNSKEIIFLKGKQQLNIYLKNNNHIDKLNNMDRAYENYQLQITYNTQQKYGVIFSIDGLNNITYHYPENLFSTTELEVGKEVTLPTSYVLDSAPYFEKFYLITGTDSFNTDLVKKAVNNINILNGEILEDLSLPESYYINTIMLLKE